MACSCVGGAGGGEAEVGEVRDTRSVTCTMPHCIHTHSDTVPYN